MEIAIPEPITAWMRRQRWGEQHLHLHIARLWPHLPESQQAFLTQSGLRPSPLWVERANSSLFYLGVMRILRRQVIDTFPEYADVFDGWSWPPSSDLDDDGPLPGLGSISPLPETALNLLSNLKEDYALSRNHRDFANVIDNQNSGVVSLLIARMSDSSSPIDIANPMVGIENLRFWRLHGWLDDLWTRFQNVSGLDGSDPGYLQVSEYAQGFLQELYSVSSQTESEVLDQASVLVRQVVRDQVSVGLTLSDRPAATGWRRIDFQSASLHVDSFHRQPVLMVSGVRPTLNTEVALCPQAGTAFNEVWEIEVTARMMSIDLPTSVPYLTHMNLEWTRLTKFIKLIGANKTEILRIPEFKTVLNGI